MNTTEVLKYGHKTFLSTLDQFPTDKVNEPGACGVWSVKDIVAHLASHEQVLVEVLTSFNSSGPTPLLDQLKAGNEQFNVDEVSKRHPLTLDEVLGEYNQAHNQAMELLSSIPHDKISQVGTLPWYGSEYALDDYLVYGYYGHKREHSAHISTFRDRLANKS